MFNHNLSTDYSFISFVLILIFFWLIKLISFPPYIWWFLSLGIVSILIILVCLCLTTVIPLALNIILTFLLPLMIFFLNIVIFHFIINIINYCSNYTTFGFITIYIISFPIFTFYLSIFAITVTIDIFELIIMLHLLTFAVVKLLKYTRVKIFILHVFHILYQQTKVFSFLIKYFRFYTVTTGEVYYTIWMRFRFPAWI